MAGWKQITPRVLSIAGTDPSGGAGIQADLKSIAAAGGYGMCCTTALVAQNTQGVQEVFYPPLTFLKAQLESVFDDVKIDAVKIGMLGNGEIINLVRQWLVDHPVPVVVLDPVMVSTSGDRLLSPAAEDGIRNFLKDVDVITPNIPELAVLAEAEPADSFESAYQQASEIAAKNNVVVIVKGGHLQGGDAGNTAVFPDGETFHVSTTRIDTNTTHGTGCSLSAALATRLGLLLRRGDSLYEKVNLGAELAWATHWLHQAIAGGAALEVGGGKGPVNHQARSRWLEQVANSYPWIEQRLDLGDGICPESFPVTSPAAPEPSVKPAGPWTAALWAATGKLWDEIINLSFVKELGDGTLDADLFAFYLEQDAQYLVDYARALANCAAGAPNTVAQVHWSSGATAAINEESGMHRTWLAGKNLLGAPSPITMAYTNFLRAICGTEDYVVKVAAVLPCYWLYVEIGMLMLEKNYETHPYCEWLKLYGSQEFKQEVEKSIELVEQAFAAAGPEQRLRACRAYLVASVYEREFFDQAHRALR